MKDIFDLETWTEIPENTSYIRSYPSLLRYFEGKSILSSEDVICGAHMVYGWMPTILTLDFDQKDLDPERAALLLMKARNEGQLSDDEISCLGDLVNHSLVGASKLLHFVAPESFAIWDSKVYTFVHREAPYHYRINNIKYYCGYLNKLKSLKEDSRFNEFHNSVNVKIGYPVSALRALELVMFLNAPELD